MSTNQINCPHCGHGYSLTPERQAQLQGKSIRCKKCKEVFNFGAASPPPLAAAPPPSLPPQQWPAPADPWAGAAAGPQYGYQAPPQQQAFSGISLASLICGIPLIPPFCLVSVILAAFGLHQTQNGRMRGRGLAITGMTLGTIGMMGMFALMVFLGVAAMAGLAGGLTGAKDAANQIKSANNLKMIGMAIKMYAMDNKGEYPPDFGTLIRESRKTGAKPENFFKSSSKAPSFPPDSPQMADWVRRGSDYTYLGGGYTESNFPQEILAFETTPSSSKGFSVLYVDGRVETRPLIELERAQRRPPPPRPSGPRELIRIR